ncbi:MAG TPA: hypothetical protein VMZ69_01135, partial [Saprospiraceae bacterium]|nr:hypothetical protein [Saprospiraceae bacterium]
MNRSNQFYITCYSVSLVLLLLSACKPDEPIEEPDACPPKDQLEMWNCHHEKMWDTTSTRFALLGIWE